MTSHATLGAHRDRTNLYISFRQSYDHHPSKRPRYSAPSHHGFSPSSSADSERAGLMSDMDSADAVIEMDLLPPRWLDTQDEITQHLSTIASLMTRLDSLHARHVLPGFDDDTVKAREQRDIDALTTQITRAFNASQRAISRIATAIHSSPSTSQAEITMARNLQISLATRVGDTSTLFRKKQSAYLKRLRALEGLSTPARASTPQNPYTDPALAEQAADLTSAESTLQQTAQVRKRAGGTFDSVISQREREIEKIAQGVIDLSQIFQELNSMVIDQGSLLDRIDYNVERTKEDVKGAEKELKVATGYQKKGTRRLVILLLILLVVGMFILVLVKPRKQRGGGGETVVAPGDPGLPINPPALPPGRRFVRVVDEVGGNGRRKVEWKKRRRRVGRRLEEVDV